MRNLIFPLKVNIITWVILVGLLITMSGFAQPVLSLNPSLESLQHPHLEANRLAQLTRLNQIRDVSPRERYYPALKRLIEQYGIQHIALVECPFIDVKPSECKPSPLFRGNAPLLRRDFVMVLNEGLDRLNELIAAGVDNPILAQNDVEVVARSLEQELTQIETRLTQLERKVSP